MEDRLAVLPQRLVGVHPGAVVAIQRLGQEGCGLAHHGSGVAHDVLVLDDVVGHGGEGVEANVDFSLTGGRDLVMVYLDGNPGRLEVHDHLAAQVLIFVARSDREIAALRLDPVAVTDLIGIGVGIEGFDAEPVVIRIGAERDAVEYEELRFRAHVDGIGDPGTFQERLCPLGYPTRILAVEFAADRIGNIGHDDQRLVGGERIDEGRGRVRQEDHVGGFDRLESLNRRAVKAETLVEGVGFEAARRQTEVLPASGDIGKADIDKVDGLSRNEIDRFLSSLEHRNLPKNFVKNTGC